MRQAGFPVRTDRETRLRTMCSCGATRNSWHLSSRPGARLSVKKAPASERDYNPWESSPAGLQSRGNRSAAAAPRKRALPGKAVRKDCAHPGLSTRRGGGGGHGSGGGEAAVNCGRKRRAREAVVGRQPTTVEVENRPSLAAGPRIQSLIRIPHPAKAGQGKVVREEREGRCRSRRRREGVEEASTSTPAVDGAPTDVASQAPIHRPPAS
jgi:hypothetical protein